MSYDGDMVRTTIYLPDDLKAALEARAEADGRTESDIIREALAEKLHGTGRTARQMRFGLFDSGTSATSTDVDEILAATGFGAA
jgi:predicted transcriptional regulator